MIPGSSPPKRLVVKLGTGILTSGPGQIDRDCIADVCRQVADLRSRGIEILVVTSGAVGLGMGILGRRQRPRTVSKLQACAAVGQSKLMQTWQDGFEPHGIIAAQVLLTHDDLRLRKRYLAVQGTLEHLITSGVVPVINENDAVSSEEIRVGDNDQLSAMVASITGSSLLIILSTAPGLIDRKGSGRIIPVIENITPEIEAMAGGTTSATAVGGMVTKIEAARLAGKAGCNLVIAHGHEKDVLLRAVLEGQIGTVFVASSLPMESKKRWLAFFQRPQGTIHVDDGARTALVTQGRSLLASGVRGSTGDFAARDIVNLTGPDNVIFGRGQACFSSREIQTIMGKTTQDLRGQFPGRTRLEVIHRNSLVVL
ncbi:MAG: glutamate 5-kinase [Opitutaceae bacterium]